MIINKHTHTPTASHVKSCVQNSKLYSPIKCTFSFGYILISSTKASEMILPNSSVLNADQLYNVSTKAAVSIAYIFHSYGMVENLSCQYMCRCYYFILRVVCSHTTKLTSPRHSYALYNVSSAALVSLKLVVQPVTNITNG